MLFIAPFSHCLAFQLIKSQMKIRHLNPAQRVRQERSSHKDKNNNNNNKWVVPLFNTAKIETSQPKLSVQILFGLDLLIHSIELRVQSLEISPSLKTKKYEWHEV